MNIAIVGYGRMGHEIEEAAISRGHKIAIIVDKDNLNELDGSGLRNVDVAVEFTTPETAFGNVSKCLGLKVPVVCGTTGWLKDYEKASAICKASGTSFIHSSNFSIGVNILFHMNAELAKLMSKHPEYKPFIEEIHHIKKLDAPSGTAITLAGGISAEHNGYNGWVSAESLEAGKIPVGSVREGMVPGVHTVTWDSDVDRITLKHETKNRKGLAAGAVIAAEYICGRKGVFTMGDVLGF